MAGDLLLITDRRGGAIWPDKHRKFFPEQATGSRVEAISEGVRRQPGVAVIEVVVSGHRSR